MNITYGDLVAVQGIGGIGHLALQFCRKMGYRTAALSSGSAKKDLALQLGADYYIDGSKEDQAQALAKLGGAKVIAATAPNPEIISKLIPGLAPSGQLVILAIAPPAEVPLGGLIAKRLSIVGWPAGTAAESEDTMNFAAQTGVKTWVTTFPLDKANDAYNHRANARFRAVIVP
jgi:D-arabinose 1-dehydrogenase-like Zn-dependent alcohol dehydrogenase